MAQLNEGDVEITLNGQTLVLRPTLRAMNAISSSNGGLNKVRQMLVDQEFSTVVSVIMHGANLAGQRDAKELPEAVYRNGLDAPLLVSLINYVAILANGGKPLPDSGQDEQPQALTSAEGNAS
jgi:hypothetical protein